MSIGKQPIRILLFTSATCKFCPEVERIVRGVVGAGLGATVSITTVDIDISPQIAEQYNITKLPSVVMNNELVLFGLMQEEDVKDKLWNSLFSNILQAEEKQDKKKENMFFIIQRTLDSIKGSLIRKNIGDYVHLGTLQMTNLSILSLDILAPLLLYTSGRELGMYGASQMLLLITNPNIGNEIKSVPRFYEILKALEMLYSDPSKHPLFVSENAKLIEKSDTGATLRIWGSAYSVGISNVGEPLCHILAGEIAGSVQVLLGKHVKVTETSCWGLGDEYCDFKIEILNEEQILRPESDTGKKEAMLRRNTFLSKLYDVSKTISDSLFMKVPLRKRVMDYVHISLIQEEFMGIKFQDPFCSILLYSAGREFGIGGPGKEILQKKLMEKNMRPPLNLEEAVKLLTEYYQHPTNMLPRQYAFVDCEIEDEETAYIIIKECAHSSGSMNVGETFCDFEAGFIAGRIQLLIEDSVIVKEIECHGKGDNYCKFEIVIE